MKTIVAVDENFAIGLGGKMLFSLPLDLKHFQQNTKVHVVIMGRKTLLSLPGGKPLKDRVNIVLSKNPDFKPEGIIVAHSYEELPSLIKPYTLAGKKIFVIGGARIYSDLIDYCSEAIITHIHSAAPKADSFFPEITQMLNWEKTEETKRILDKDVETSYAVYKNKNVKSF